MILASLKIRHSLTALALLLAFMSTSVYSEEDQTRQNLKPSDGELVLPDDYQKKEEKKCLTVCDQWGEDCIINPGTGSRKCRRVCKSFTEECF